jgi:hypothetical protein
MDLQSQKISDDPKPFFGWDLGDIDFNIRSRKSHGDFILVKRRLFILLNGYEFRQYWISVKLKTRNWRLKEMNVHDYEGDLYT